MALTLSIVSVLTGIDHHQEGETARVDREQSQLIESIRHRLDEISVPKPAKKLSFSLKETVEHLKQLIDILCTGAPEELAIEKKLDQSFEALRHVSEWNKMESDGTDRLHAAMLRMQGGISEFSAAALGPHSSDHMRALRPVIDLLGDSVQSAIDAVELEDAPSSDYFPIVEGIAEIVKTMAKVCASTQ